MDRWTHRTERRFRAAAGHSEAGAAERWAGAGLVSKWCCVNWIHVNKMRLDSYLTPCTVNVGWVVEASRR